MKLIFVPAGEFLMGNDNGARDERPAHSIYLDTFWIDETEVTNAMYKLCEQDGICNQPFETIYYSDPEFVENPVNYVSWDDAKTYCSWADRRLPTEAEWEKVASWDSNSQTKRIYPWGEMIDCSFANYYSEDGCIGYPSKVGSYPSGVSPYGALDMAGNVMEWVSDFYDETYYFNSPSSNPPGPTSGMYHVLRGGSFLDDISQVRSSARQSAGNIWETFYDMVGFRCAMSNTN
jgi:serine/threonine-protein kinase